MMARYYSFPMKGTIDASTENAAANIAEQMKRNWQNTTRLWI